MYIKKLYGRNGEYLAERVDNGERVRLYASNGRYLGEYHKASDRTYDAGGSCVGFGDLLGVLICDAHPRH